MPKTCSRCGAENVIQAKTCKACGAGGFVVGGGEMECPKCYYAPTDEADLKAHLESSHRTTLEAAQSAPSKPKPAANNSAMGCLVIVVFALVVAGCMALFDSGSDGGSKSEGGAADERIQDMDPEVQRFSAFEACKDLVSDRLKAPGSATFRNFFQDDGEVVVTDDGGGEFTVVSSVDAENSFGAELRTNFVCTVADAGDRWRLVDLQMDE